MKTLNVLMSGVGGQGVILASKILSDMALRSGFDIKQSEVHGMSQRGGSVVSHVRIGDKVHSPLVPEGQCDILLAFEPLEGLRFAHWVRGDGVIIYSTDRINPSTVSAGLAKYPDDTGKRLEAYLRLADLVGHVEALGHVVHHDIEDHEVRLLAGEEFEGA